MWTGIKVSYGISLRWTLCAVHIVLARVQFCTLQSKFAREGKIDASEGEEAPYFWAETDFDISERLCKAIARYPYMGNKDLFVFAFKKEKKNAACRG